VIKTMAITNALVLAQYQSCLDASIFDRRTNFGKMQMPNRYLARSTGMAAHAPDGTVLVMSPVDSVFLTLNEVAGAIWRAADGRTHLADIVENRICPEFEIDPALARYDAAKFVDELSRLGVLHVSPHPFEGAIPAAFQGLESQ
jgi:Coenzyme PQQ synthesis protein D (PqqD)